MITTKLIRKACAKLRSDRGESLTEVLAAILIGGLALLVLSMAITVSTSLNAQSRVAMDDYYEISNQLAVGNATNGAGQVTLRDDDDLTVIRLDNDGGSVAVDYFFATQVDGTEVVSYEASDEVTP